MTDTPIEERIAQKTDLAVAGSIEVSSNVGGLAFRDASQVMEFSKLMAVSGQAVPRHLRGAPGACLAIVTQSLNWRMDPFAVANKSYMVNDRIAYEAQLLQAVIEQRAPIKGRIKGDVSGEGDKRKWTLRVVSAEDGDTITFDGVEIGKITTKNSPLWKSDPDQQLWYYTVRAMCRRHFPDVILGVYEREEVEYGEPMRDVTPKPSRLAEIAAEVRAKQPESAQERAEGADEPVPEGEEDSPADRFAALDASGAFPGSDAWARGESDAKEGRPETDCPYDAEADIIDYLGGHRGQVKAMSDG